jgi:hypothetical protein
MHPRIQSVRGGALVAIQFGDAIALCARGSTPTLCFCPTD